MSLAKNGLKSYIDSLIKKNLCYLGGISIFKISSEILYNLQILILWIIRSFEFYSWNFTSILKTETTVKLKILNFICSKDSINSIRPGFHSITNFFFEKLLL